MNPVPIEFDSNALQVALQQLEANAHEVNRSVNAMIVSTSATLQEVLRSLI